LSFLFEFSTILYANTKGMQPAPTGRVNKNILGVRTGCVSFYLYQKEGYTIALDSGFGRDIAVRELSILRVKPESISAVFLTHTDIDHADGISLFKNADIYFSADEEQMIRYKTPRKFGVVFNSGINRPYKLLRQDDEVFVGGIKVRAIETPGHTPGSMCYLIDDAFLFSGDAFNLLNGKAYPVSRAFTMDQETQLKSMKKLAGLKGVKMAFTAHRGYTEHFEDALAGYR